jgi:triphosphoribosyl-dephospho-CoA synthase
MHCLIARQAVRALYAELALEPKPGLVSFRDNGSHTDMTASTFFKSLFALRHYFGHMAHAGAQSQPFDRLQTLGFEAELQMLRATGGINTHRGAVFALGLLCAAAGRLVAQNQPFSSAAVRATLLAHWGAALQSRAIATSLDEPRSNGQRAARRYHLRGAGEEAALGFPILFELTLPVLQQTLQRGHGLRAARVQAFFATMAVLDDTNTAHRGGWAGVQLVKQAAKAFLEEGGVDQPNWVQAARQIHASFVARRLSPGGAADVLACACWLRALTPTKSHTTTNPALATANLKACATVLP